MTNEEAFYTVLFAMRNQKVKSKVGSHCCYRGDNRTKCSIGHLISDETYHRIIEGCTINSLVLYGVGTSDKYRTFKSVLAQNGFEKDQYEFLGYLQDAHDCFMPTEFGCDMTQFENRMRFISKNFGIPFIEKESYEKIIDSFANSK